VDAYFGLGFPETTLAASMDRLFSSNRILRSDDGIYYLPPGVSEEAMERVKAARELETRVRDEWLDEVSQFQPQIISSEQQDRLWNALQSYMAKAFHRHGAQTVKFLDPTIPIPPEVDTNLSTLLQIAVEESAVALPPEIAGAAIRGFFRNQTPDRTKYLVQLLDATFSFFALSTDEATSKYLRGAFQPMAIFLDTNFIFGILNLHSNPLVAVSHELVSFIDHHHLPFTLYYHAKTLEEMKRTVYSIGQVLRARRWRTAISRAAVRNGQMSGLELRYHELNATKPIDPEAFLTMYEHPEPLLKEHGFVIYRQAQPRDGDIERRAELVAEYKDFVESRRSPKPYASYDHDMTVWLATQDKRVVTDSILEAGALFLTCDYHLYVFDQKVLRQEPQLGLVVMPNHFLQMLRPLVPASDDFDRRFVETFAIPEFRVVGSDYAATVSKVLSYLTVFSNIGEKTATRILADELLIQRLRGIDEDSEEFRTSIENALAGENEQLLEEVAQWKLEAERARAEQAKAIRNAEAKAQTLTEKDAELQRLNQAQEEYVKKLEALATKVEQSEKGRTQIEQALREEVQATKEDYERIVAGWRIAFGILFGVAGLAVLIGARQIWEWTWLVNHPNRLGLYGCASLIIVAIGWAVADPKRRKFALGTFALGVVFVLLQILGR